MRSYADVYGNNRTLLLGDEEYKQKLKSDRWVRDEEKEDKTLTVRAEAGGISDFEDLPFFLKMSTNFVLNCSASRSKGATPAQAWARIFTTPGPTRGVSGRA